jgi:hypothetical protein
MAAVIVNPDGHGFLAAKELKGTHKKFNGR